MRVRGLRRSRQFRAPLHVLLCALASVVVLVVGNGSGRAATPDFIHADGTRLVDVEWDGQMVMMFTVDLRERGTLIKQGSAQHDTP